MKKTLIGGIALLIAILIFGLGFHDSLPFTKDKRSLLEGYGNEIENTYLKLFREYKTSNLSSKYSQGSTHKSSVALNRNPFKVPEIRRNQGATKAKNLASRKTKKRHRSGLKLTAILWDETSPGAVINNRVVHPGSRIGTYRVAGIRQDRVILASNKKTKVLKLPEPYPIRKASILVW